MSDKALQGNCAHKKLSPVFGIEIFGLCFTTFWLLVCNCGGVATGGTMIPLLMMIFQFSAKDSIAISNSIIASSALLRFLVNFNMPHPLKFDTFGKPAGTLIDYNLTLILVPSIIIGSAIGVIINYMLATPI